MVDAVVEFLLENVTRILSEEIGLLLGVKDEVQLLQDDLTKIHLYLKRFDGRRNEDDISQEYAKQIRGLVHQAEDVIDSYVASNVQQRGSFLWKAKAVAKKIPIWRKTSKQIRSIRERLNKLYQERGEFGQGNEMGAQQHTFPQRRRGPYGEVDMVGFEQEVDEITQRLTGGPARLEVITVVGMSGLGKTTLASYIYNDPTIADHFPIRAWISVSQRYSLRSLLETIIKDITNIAGEDVEKMGEEKLSFEIQDYLSRRKYLVVLDDVWQPELWNDVSKLFAGIRYGIRYGNRYGSRIIVTTQINDVALSIQHNTMFPLRFLTEEESWKLLSKRIFHKRECSGLLRELGIEIANKCKGLPLAILVVAGVLKRHETTAWWSQVSSGVNAYISDRKEQCLEILELSYNHLPVRLRQCFLYFGLFPEDHEIHARLLICLWIAEGFIPKKRRRTDEVVAEECLNELIDRNLVQVVKRRSDGTLKSCRIHDLLRAFCISKANDEQYLEIREDVDSSSACSARRLALHSKALHYLNSNQSSSNLRSLLLFGGYCVESRHWEYLYQGYMLLRVLEMGGIFVDNIPNEIERLICLRYLRFKSNTISTLPASICNLWNLQMLEIIAGSVGRQEIKNIWKMRQLRHLYFNGGIVLPQPPRRMIRDNDDYHRNLQTLSSINPDSCTEVILGKLRNLVKLGIFGDLRKLEDLTFTSLSRLERLIQLKLTSDTRYDNLTWFPSIELLDNIEKLTLTGLGLVNDPMTHLQKLSKLKVLKLKCDAYVGSILDCTQGEFPRLEVLKLIDLSFTEWNVSAESLPHLKLVVISDCGSLSDLPTSLAHISALEELQLSRSSTSVASRASKIKDLKKERGEDLVVNQV